MTSELRDRLMRRMLMGEVDGRLHQGEICRGEVVVAGTEGSDGAAA
jgi:hypothetical protein